MANLIEFSNIVQEFDNNIVLKGVNLQIEENEFVTLLGPSGCGKTTLLRILGGFLAPTQGKVIFDGKDITDVPAYKREINTVFQKYALFPHLNVYDNIAFGLKIKKEPKDIIAQKVNRMLKLVGLEEYGKRAVTETVISQLLSIDLKKSKALQFARDLFIFSFYARGMAFVDIVYLKKSNIQNGYITYVRHKTGQELTIRIETRLQNIINQYEKKDSPYLFPILNTEDENKAYSQYEIALNYYNRQLKRLSKLLEPNINLSSYTPRHTWATTARNKNVPLSIISAGMGHSSEKTTLIYLTKIDNSIIDEVNKAIIDSIKQ